MPNTGILYILARRTHQYWLLFESLAQCLVIISEVGSTARFDP